MKKVLNSIVLLLFALLPFKAHANDEAKGGEELNIPEIVLEHLADSYEWHIATYEGKSIHIPLPVIIRSSQTGDWYICTVENLPEGFFINPEHHHKIYEKMADGTVERPIDLSITKVVAEMIIVVTLLLIVFCSCARWYRKRGEITKAPKGFVGAMEMIVMFIHDDLIKPALGEKHYRKYSGYLLSLFFFILFTNLVGLFPVFPGGVNVTGNINITLALALFTMLIINLFGNKEYWKEIFNPEVPILLKFPIPLMPVIEFVGIITKPFALMIRLFANMMAGHAVMLSFTCVIFLGWTLGTGIGIGLNIFSLLMLLFMNVLELLVAFVQAYVFTMLSAVFIGLAHKDHHKEQEA